MSLEVNVCGGRDGIVHVHDCTKNVIFQYTVHIEWVTHNAGSVCLEHTLETDHQLWSSHQTRP